MPQFKVNVPFCRAQGSKTPLPQLAELEDQFVVDEGPSVNAAEENNALKNSGKFSIQAHYHLISTFTKVMFQLTVS